VTPGGLGVVEASLAALLVAPGTSDDVLAASVIYYRLISYWLVVVVGVVALVAERTQSGRARRHKAAAAQAGKPVKTPAAGSGLEGVIRRRGVSPRREGWP
jgi:putative heme transporter